MWQDKQNDTAKKVKLKMILLRMIYFTLVLVDLRNLQKHYHLFLILNCASQIALASAQK